MRRLFREPSNQSFPRNLKPLPFKNKKQKISEQSDVLNAIVLQTVDYAGSSSNIQNNHRGREFFLKLVGTSQNWPKYAVLYRLNARMHKRKPFLFITRYNPNMSKNFSVCTKARVVFMGTEPFV